MTTGNTTMTTFGLLQHTNINHGSIPPTLQPKSTSLGTNNTSTTRQHHTLLLLLLENSNTELNMSQMLLINSNMTMNTFGI
jgi:hypothetical protein